MASPREFNWDKITALSAVFIGACALLVSLYTAFLQRSQVRAQTWPFLQLWQTDEGRAFSVSNRGVGPARILDVKVRVDGAEVGTFIESFRKLSGHEPKGLKVSYFARRVLAANEDVRMATFDSDAEYQVFRDGRARMSFAICYCSLLNECYLIDERAAGQELRPVAACPVGDAGQFH